MNDFCNYFPEEEFKTDFETSLVESCQSPVENNYLNYSNLGIEFEPDYEVEDVAIESDNIEDDIKD